MNIGHMIIKMTTYVIDILFMWLEKSHVPRNYFYFLGGGIIPATILLPKTLKSEWNSIIKVLKELLSSEISDISVINGYKPKIFSCAKAFFLSGSNI